MVGMEARQDVSRPRWSALSRTALLPGPGLPAIPDGSPGPRSRTAGGGGPATDPGWAAEPRRDRPPSFLGRAASRLTPR